MTCEHEFRTLSREAYEGYERDREDTRFTEEHSYICQLFFCTKCLEIRRVILSDIVKSGSKRGVLYAAHRHAKIGGHDDQ